MDVHQFATSLVYGDAISDEMLEIQKALRSRGHNSEIFIRFYDPRMARHIKDYREYRKYSSPENVVIFHFSIGSPVSKMFFRIPDKKIMIYHNITPHEFFLDYHRVLTRECYKGRLEINLFVGKVDLALGDSEFNRRELERVGYSPTGVQPILLDFSKFDVPGDPVVRSIFDNGKTTLLFVGRVIPNKKFEDVIKTFYFYKKHYNPDSQLILAGDSRGIERYHAALQDLIRRLHLTDVHITGHVAFEELVTYYRLADLYLSFSEHEGFGVPLLEAFHFGIPVAAYAAGAVEETMNGGGLLLWKKDFAGTAALIDTVLRDEGLRRTIVDGQSRALRKYRTENVARILLGHVDSVCRGGGR
ncbi:MAG TPA: glycosyltransferase family 4 protein [Candidatus Aminicenantes bacterium]|nr:glycosyltransferase family 4 protein [Candidatus Aminicenantes bacterium]